VLTKTISYVIVGVKGGKEMNVADAIREVLYWARMTQQELGEKLGGRQSLISTRLSRGNRVAVSKVLEMIEPCGYEMVLQPKRKRRPKEQILVTEDMGKEGE